MYIIHIWFNIIFCSALDTSNSSSDSEEGTVDSYFYGENILDENDDDDIDSEPPVFDTSKEIDYKTKYKQTVEEVISLNNVYILNLDAQKS